MKTKEARNISRSNQVDTNYDGVVTVAEIDTRLEDWKARGFGKNQIGDLERLRAAAVKAGGTLRYMDASFYKLSIDGAPLTQHQRVQALIADFYRGNNDGKVTRDEVVKQIKNNAQNWLTPDQLPRSYYTNAIINSYTLLGAFKKP